MAYDTATIRAYIDNIYAQGGTNADVARAMDQFGVTPTQVAQAYSDVPGMSAEAVRGAYTAALPTGTYATSTPAYASPSEGGIPGTGYTEPVVDPLAPAPGTSQIDPVIAPYLSEALGKARSLFLTGKQPELYPGQMYVSPSAQTLSALSQVEQLAGAAAPFYEQAQRGITTGLTGLEQTAGGAFLGGSPYRTAMIEAATRPITQQFTEEVMPGIQSAFSKAGRYGSGAQGAVTGRATEGYTRALGDVTSQIAAQDYARERGFQEAATRDVLAGAGQLGNIFSSFLAPSQALGQVGAQREAIAGQPLQEAIQRFEYTQNLPQQQFANYMASIYGSPLGGVTAQQKPQTNVLGQTLGGGILGSQLGSLFKGYGTFSGEQIGAGLGALGGLLL